jgi:hypothetical protein
MLKLWKSTYIFRTSRWLIQQLLNNFLTLNWMMVVPLWTRTIAN